MKNPTNNPQENNFSSTNKQSKTKTTNKRNTISREIFLNKSLWTLGGLGAIFLGLTEIRNRKKVYFSTNSKKYKCRMVTTWPKNFSGLGIAANNMAKSMTEMSEGQLEVKVLGAGELVPAFECFDAVSRGVAEMGHGASYYWRGKIPQAQFFSCIPFGLNATEMNTWIKEAGGQALWDSCYADFQIKPFPCGNTGVQMGGWFQKEIKSVDDFKSIKIRMPGLGGEVLRQFGTTVVSLPGGELFQSLQTNVINATEWLGPYNDLAFGFHKIAKYYYWPGWHEPGTNLEFIINRTFYENLPKHLQIIVARACDAMSSNMAADYYLRNSIALRELTSKHGVKLLAFSNEILASLKKVSQEVVDDLATKNPQGKEIYDSYLKFSNLSEGWYKISEYALAQARYKTTLTPPKKTSQKP